MVVGNDFIWCHFMKTGGHAVELALRSGLRHRRDIAFDTRRNGAPGWHDSPYERSLRDPQFSTAGKQIICGFRRLPHWIISRVHYEAARSPNIHASRDMIIRGCYFENDGSTRRADEYLSLYLEANIDRWIRQEFLEEDFEKHFGRMVGSRLPIAKRKLSASVNVTPLNYVRDPRFFFTHSDLEYLYGCNPLWSAVEQQIYGHLFGF